MFVEDIYNFIMFLKNQGQSQWFPPEEVMNALNRAQIDKYNHEYKRFEETQEVTDAFSVFKTKSDIVFTEGKYELPENYFHATNISSVLTTGEGEEAVTTEHKGKLYTDGEWLDARESTLLPPLPAFIKGRVIDGEVEIVPNEGVTTIRLYYLREFKDAVFAYDLVDQKITFKEQGSVDPEWPRLEHNDLIGRTLKYLGIPLHDKVFIQAEQFLQQPATS